MKQVFALLSLCTVLTVNAQNSNPYNDNAVAIINKLQAVLPDLQTESISSFNQKKINRYIDQFNSSASTATSITDGNSIAFTLSEEKLADYISNYNNYGTVIQSTDFSNTTKSFLQTLQTPQSLSSTFDYEIYNSQINSSTIPDSEKEILLTISALRYNAINANVGDAMVANRNSNEESGCNIGGGNHLSPLGCGLFFGSIFAFGGAAGGGGPIGAAVGFVVGFSIAFFGSK